MRIRLHSPVRKIAAALLCVVVAAAYLYVSGRCYVAYRASTVLKAESIERAVSLEPGNADYRNLLGAYYYSEQNAARALDNFEAATQLNPTVADYWLNIAMADLTLGKVEQQGAALNNALEADPTTPDVAWEAGNYYLVQGDTSRALHLMGVVLRYDDSKAEQTLALCWRSVGDADRIMKEALPPRADRYLDFLQLLVAKKNVAASERVWGQMLSLGQSVPPKATFPFLQLLIDSGRASDADAVWRELIALDRMQAYLPGNNLVANGDFEQEILNGGFDWRYVINSNVSLSIDTNTLHSGARSLSLTFNGGSGPVGVSHLVFVKPDKNYELSAYYRTDELVSASGPRFVIVDPNGSQSVETDEMLGAASWRQIRQDFRTGPNTRIVELRIARIPDNLLIRGRLVIDDVSIMEK